MGLFDSFPWKRNTKTEQFSEAWYERNRYKPKVENLEDRITPTADFFVVPGQIGDTTPVMFTWESSSAAFNNTLIVYEVDDTSGSVNGVAPTDVNYVDTLVRSGRIQTVFQTGQTAGTIRTFGQFMPETVLGFALITNAPASLWGQVNQTTGRVDNAFGTGPVAWFSFDGPNPENFDPVMSQDIGGGAKRFFFEDLGAGGDRDYRDMVFTVGTAPERAFNTAGFLNQTVPVQFNLLQRNSAFNSEMGIFLLDSTAGEIEGLFPGDPGYLELAMDASRRQIVFSNSAGVGTFNQLTLPALQPFAFYLVQNGSFQDVLAGGGVGNTVPGGAAPQMFFWFDEMNSDLRQHFRFLSPGVIGVEDQFGGGDNDFDDLVFSMNILPAEGDVFAPNITATLVNDTGRSATDKITSDPKIQGTVTDESPIVKFEAQLSNGSFVDVTNTLQPDGSFIFDETTLETIIGQPLANLNDGSLSFRLRATDEPGNITIITFNYTLDRSVNPGPSVEIDPDFDSGPKDLTTNFSEITLIGRTEANSQVTLKESGGGTIGTTFADANGNFSFGNVGLNLGANDFELEVEDVAGNEFLDNQNLFSFTITRVDNTAPTFDAQGNPIGNVDLNLNDPATAVELAQFFDDADLSDILLRFNLIFGNSTGSVDMQLFTTEAPATVANFMNYVESGAYNNVIFHRSVDGFVLQGGGFEFIDNPTTPTLDNVNADPAVVNEPDAVNRSNLRSTVAMAKLGNNPNSATTEFFVNLDDNSGPPPALDTQNGGFTVFGEIVDGMTIIDQISSVPTEDRGGPFTDIPLFNNLPSGDFVENPANSNDFDVPSSADADNFAIIDSVSIERQLEKLTYTVNVINESSAGFVNSVVTVNNRLIINPTMTGTATISITATDSANNQVTSNEFTITIT